MMFGVEGATCGGDPNCGPYECLPYDPCPGGTCEPDTSTPECATDDECGDMNPCTIDACVEGACQSTSPEFCIICATNSLSLYCDYTVDLITLQVIYETIIGDGETTLVGYLATPELPASFSLLVEPSYVYKIETTAEFDGPVTVCLNYDEPEPPINESSFRLLHEEAGVFEDRTVLPVNTIDNIVCAQVTSFSDFVLAYESVCADTDWDGICDIDDNCLVNVNPDQIDTDGDGAGDACDLDDDNDGVVDTEDNCPLEVNPDQSDADSDGAGDVCDGDGDNDGVLDAADHCLNTIVGEIVDETGCAIVDLCPCQNDWKNHGAYVSCVAQAAENFVMVGLMTEVEKDASVSAAAESTCGQRTK